MLFHQTLIDSVPLKNGVHVPGKMKMTYDCVNVDFLGHQHEQVHFRVFLSHLSSHFVVCHF